MTTETTPELLAVGDQIVGARDGKVWEVTKLDPGMSGDNDDGTPRPFVTMRPQAGGREAEIEAAKLPPKITLVSTLVEREARARALLQVRLGAEVIAERQNAGKGGPWEVPAAFPDVGGLLAHLYLFHFVKESPKDGTTYPDGDLTDVIAAHRHMHDTGRTAEAHEHSPTFYRDMEVTP